MTLVTRAGKGSALTAAEHDANLTHVMDRGNHTGSQAASTISDFNSAARAQVEAMLTAGANVTLTPSGSGATRSIAVAASGGGGGTWGSITGTLSSQTDLQSALDAKLALAGGTMTGKLVTTNAVAGGAGFNIGTSTADPSSPVNGDFWGTNAGQIKARLNGATAVVATLDLVQTFSAKQTFPAGASGSASIRLIPGTAPSSPVNGDLWLTSTALFAQINSATRTIATLDGGTFTGALVTPASATGGAGFRLPHGAAPTSPVNGDVWTTTAGLYARVNGATVGPFGAGGSGLTSLFDVRNESGSTLAVGAVVRISGYANSRPLVTLADADGSGTMPALGILPAAITNNTNGQMVTSGFVSGLNTSGMTVGAPLYVSTTAGAFTTTAPTIGLAQVIGFVTRADAVNGEILFAPQPAGTVLVDGAAQTDANSNNILVYGVTASAVNAVKVTNAATGNRPKLEVAGSDTNIGLEIGVKGTGRVLINRPIVADAVNDIGTVSSGTTTLDAANGHNQKMVNGGASTLAPQTADPSTITLKIANNGSAGTLTTSGYTKVVGDAFTTTNGHKFLCTSQVIDGDKVLTVTAMQ